MAVHIMLIILIAIAVFGNIDGKEFSKWLSESTPKKKRRGVPNVHPTSPSEFINGVAVSRLMSQSIYHTTASFERFRGHSVYGYDAYAVAMYLSKIYATIGSTNLNARWNFDRLNEHYETLGGAGFFGGNGVTISRMDDKPNDVTLDISGYSLIHVHLIDLIEFQRNCKNFDKFLSPQLPRFNQK